MSKVIVVIGAQWGDEGKGKIVDLLAERFDVVARYQGGHNAGHSVKVGDKSYALHLIPSGIIHPGKTCVLGNGMVIDPIAFFAEADRLTAQGLQVTPSTTPARSAWATRRSARPCAASARRTKTRRDGAASASPTR
jgi:adenylosuccinate synthase